MDLSEVLEARVGYRLAGREDNARLLEFFNQSPMQGAALSLRYERDPDFFAFPAMQADESFVIAGESAKSGSIGAIGTLSIRPGYIQGEARTVGYLGDLRVAFDRRLLLQWRAILSDLVGRGDEIRELQGCRHFLSAVIDENKAGLQALAGGRAAPFVFRPIARYRMVNILGRAPWALAREKGFSVSRATAADLPALTDFLERQNRPRAFGFRFAAELPRRLARWPGLRPESFWIARRGDRGAIAGCFAPWSPSPAKRIVVERMPARLRALCLGMRLVRGDAPRTGAELKVRYLTHLEIPLDVPGAEREAVLRALLGDAWRAGAFEGSHLVAFADFDSAPLARGLRGCFLQQTPMTLYQVLPRARASDEAMQRIGELPPAFEMALV